MLDEFELRDQIAFHLKNIHNELGRVRNLHENPNKSTIVNSNLNDILTLTNQHFDLCTLDECLMYFEHRSIAEVPHNMVPIVALRQILYRWDLRPNSLNLSNEKWMIFVNKYHRVLNDYTVTFRG